MTIDGTGPLVSCTGIATSDTVFGVDHLPSGDGKCTADWLADVGGGVAANAAVAVARLGGRSRFIGVTGDDPRGRSVRHGLIAEGVRVDGMHELVRSTTPTSAVIVDRFGGRMIVNHVSDGFFERAEPRWGANIGQADAVLVDLRWIAGATESVQAARRLHVPAVVDVDRPVEIDTPLLVDASHLLFSADALRQMTGTERPVDALRQVKTSTPAWVGVTLGADGVVWLDGETRCSLSAHRVEAIDTLGAGDTFHGAFTLGLAEGLAEAHALRFANAAAALKCQTKGGRSGIPSRSSVRHFLERHEAVTCT